MKRFIAFAIFVFVFVCASGQDPVVSVAQTRKAAPSRVKAATNGATPTTPSALATDLFISEYIEGSTNNRAIEIYNGTGAAVDMAAGNYSLEVYANGAATTNSPKLLNQVIANGDVFVLIHPSATNSTIQAQADDSSSTLMGAITGNDAVVLKKGSVIIDVIGQVGFNPGTEWGTGNTSTADNTLVRKPEVCGGDTNASNAFDPASEWNGFAIDTVSNLGSHTANCAAPLPNLTINDVSLAEGNAGTTTFDFTISLSSPAPAGGVTFDIATADNTALQASDYAAKSTTAQSIAQGSSTGTFSVSVNGDLVYEPNETFFVNVTNVVGATVTDGQGQGTVTNDDLAPSAGPASVSGRVLTRAGRGVMGAVVTLTGQDGIAVTARTNSFGYFSLPQVLAGESYVLTIRSKRYRFSPQLVNLDADIAGLSFYAEQ